MSKILQIEYKKDNKIRYIDLCYKKSIWILMNKCNIVLESETEILELKDKFSTDESLEEKDGYFNIRTQEEEKELEDMLKTKLWGNNIKFIERKKITIVIIITVTITIGIILCFLIPYAIKCNSY